MNWYYADQGSRSGPVGEAELDELVRSGAVSPSTLVWTEGMPDWKPYSAVHATAQETSTSNEGACVCCGRQVPADQAVLLGTRLTCATCKPVFVERLREGDLLQLPGGLPYAGFWIRFTARMADYTLLSLVQAIFTGTFLAWTWNVKPGDTLQFFNAFGITASLGVAVSCLYETSLLATRGATIGKMLCYLRVIRPDSGPLTVGRALGRFFAELLSRITLGIGYIMAGFDSEKRALHDRIAGTRVIDAPPPGLNPTELHPVTREVRCDKCHTEIPSTEWNALGPRPCPGCNTPVLAVVFPAITRSLPTLEAQPKEGEAEAGCYYHDHNRATLACEECGRFLCPQCDLDSGSRHICPGCYNTHSAGDTHPEFVRRRTLYDSIALTAALLPNLFLITVYLTFLTAPAVVGFTIWSWKRQGSLTPRTRWRYIVALLIASVNILFFAAILIVAFASALK